MKQPVQGHPNLYKDKDSHLIVDRDESARARYRIAKKQARMNIENASELDSLRVEIEEIKSLLHQLLNK